MFTVKNVELMGYLLLNLDKCLCCDIIYKLIDQQEVITNHRNETIVPGTIGHNSMCCITLTITLASFFTGDRWNLATLIVQWVRTIYSFWINIVIKHIGFIILVMYIF